MAFSTWGFLFFYPQIYVVQSGSFCVLCGKSTPAGEKSTPASLMTNISYGQTHIRKLEKYSGCVTRPHRAISLLFKSLLHLHNCQQKDWQLLSFVPFFCCIWKTRMNVTLGLWWNNLFLPNLSQFLPVQSLSSWSNQKPRVFWRDQILRWQSSDMNAFRAVSEYYPQHFLIPYSRFEMNERYFSRK